MTILDEELYPTEEILDWIRKYDPNTDMPLVEFLSDILPAATWTPDWCITWKEGAMYFSTGGWSGNEALIEAMLDNPKLMAQLQLVERKAGGHYSFLPVLRDNFLILNSKEVCAFEITIYNYAAGNIVISQIKALDSEGKYIAFIKLKEAEPWLGKIPTRFKQKSLHH